MDTSRIRVVGVGGGDDFETFGGIAKLNAIHPTFIRLFLCYNLIVGSGGI